jgi:hypothetical protein
MADQDPALAQDPAIVQALAQIAQSLSALQSLQAQQPPVQAQAHQPVLDLFDASSPFDLGSCAGNTAYVKACSALDTKWDGSIDKFPSLITGLRDCAIEAKWDAVSPHGIITLLSVLLISTY